MPTARNSELRMVEVLAHEGPILVPCILKRSRRARNIRLSYGNGGNHAMLTVPHGVREVDALRFMQQQGAWLNARMEEYRPPRTLSSHIKQQPWLSVQGQRVPLKLDFKRGKARVDCGSGLKDAILGFDPRSPLEQQIKQALRDFAKEHLAARTYQLAVAWKVSVKRVTVRDQSTVWGSCSSRGNISLNWRLLLLPPDLHDYIILHELAHIRHMNHGPEFWQLLCRYDERAILHDRRVSELSRELMKLGR